MEMPGEPDSGPQAVCWTPLLYFNAAKGESTPAAEGAITSCPGGGCCV